MTRAFGIVVRGFGPDEGIYWAESPARARAAAYRQCSDVFDRRDNTFFDFVTRTTVRRRREFDAHYSGRQGLLPDFVVRA